MTKTTAHLFSFMRPDLSSFSFPAARHCSLLMSLAVSSYQFPDFLSAN
jgi:hypothetical protein